MAQEITQYQRRSRELSQSLFGISQTIFLTNEHYLLCIFFFIRFPNKRDALNLLNKNRINFCLKIKAGVCDFFSNAGDGLRASLMPGKCFSLWATYMSECWVSIKPDKLSWTMNEPRSSTYSFHRMKIAFRNAFSKLISSRHWQKKLIKKCSGTFIWNARQWRPHRKKISMNLKWPPVAVEVSPVPLSYYGVNRCLGHRAGTVIEVLALSTRCLL